MFQIKVKICLKQCVIAFIAFCVTFLTMINREKRRDGLRKLRILNDFLWIALLTLNVCQITLTLYCLKVASQSTPSICFLIRDLQPNEYENIWPAEWGSEVCFSHGTMRSKGTMILINPKIKCKVEKKICDKNGRCIILDILIADTRNVLANIYAPNDANQQISFFK